MRLASYAACGLQHRSYAPASRSSGQNRSIDPTTSNPCSCSSEAATDESTPPDIATSTFGRSVVSADEGESERAEAAGTSIITAAHGIRQVPTSQAAQTTIAARLVSSEWRSIVRIVRIVQIVILIVAVVYVAIVQNANPDALALPGLLPLPVWLVVALTAILAFLAGWVPATVRAWRLRREVADLESHVPSYDRAPAAPVIPDRAPPAVAEEGEAKEEGSEVEDAERTDR